MVETLKKHFTQQAEVWRKVKVQGKYGEITGDPIKIGNLYGRFESQSGSLGRSQDAVMAFKQYTFYCLFPEYEVKAKDELRYNDKSYEILFPENIQDHDRILMINCELIE